MSERLIRNDGGLICNVPCDTGEYCSCDIAKNAYIKLAHYEDLEEQGRLIELPCKVGEKVYEVYKSCDEMDFYCETRYCNRCKTGSFIYKIEESCFELSQINDVGKTIFLTREEAETKVKELRGE